MPQLIRSVLFAGGYAVAVVVGRSLTLDGQELSVVWPACGVSALWLLGLRGRVLALNAAALGVVTLMANLATHTTLGFGWTFALVNVAQALTAATILCRWSPGLWGCGGRSTLDSIPQVFRLVLAAVISSLVAATMGFTALTLLDLPASLTSFSMHWGRNTFGFLLVVATGHLVAHAMRFGFPPLAAQARRVHPPLELAALVLISAAVYSLVFLQHQLPMTFLPVVVSIWAGLRFPAVVVALHGAAGGAFALAATIGQRGPFALVAEVQERGLLLQLLLILTLIVGLSLAVTRADALRLLRQVDEARTRAAEDATLMTAITEAMAEGLVVLDTKGRVVRTNESARELLVAQPRDAAWPEVWRSIADGGPSGRADEERDVEVAVNGDRRVLCLRPSPKRMNGVATGWVVLVYDVTAERHARAELSSFAGTVAHDLRSPLASIRGWAELLQEQSGATSAQARITDRLVASTVRMGDLLSDLLSHAVTQEGALTKAPVGIGDVTRQFARSCGISDQVLVGSMPLVMADRALVDQLVGNLLGNAVKYVAPGVTPNVTLSGHRDPGTAMVRFHLVDNGIGVPAGERERVFERLHRAHREDYPGTGLGLAICRTIVERHGGTLEIDQDSHGGSTCFTFTLPALEPLALLAPV